ncbi:hypothetical protein AB0D49_33450 [Streptomyces sp. NPDC048290]
MTHRHPTEPRSLLDGLWCPYPERTNPHLPAVRRPHLEWMLR